MKVLRKNYIKHTMNLSFLLGLVLQVMSCQNTENNIPIMSASSSPQYQPSDSLLTQAEKKDTLVMGKLPKTFIDSTSKVIYFTFDDGPLTATPRLTEIINEKQIKITEFAVGKHYKSNKSFANHLEVMRRDPLIEIHNHSYSHANGRYKEFYRSPQAAANDIMDNESTIATNTKIVRMPGRDIWATPNIKRGWHQSGAKTASILLDNGFKVYGWDYEWEHRNTIPKISAERFVAQIDTLFARGRMETPNHLIVLAHDEMLATERGRTDLRHIIDMLKERNYVFEFMSYYPN
jgi:peptidoglycan-N-acetylglucosamine deacetylase